MIEIPQIVQTSVQHTAFIRFRIPPAEARNVMGPGKAELMAAVAAQGIAPTGPWFCHHLKMDHETRDFEISVPVARPFTATGRVQPGILRVMKVARTVYQGPYDILPAAWDELMHWIRVNGHTPAETLWECYVTGPESSSDPADWRTELNRPLIG